MEQTPAYTRYFDWDGRDMLAGVRSTEQGWTDNVYRYDGLASRVSTLESGGLTYYDWDSINVLQEKDADGDVTDRQVHGHAPIFSVGDIALMDKSGTPYVPVSDQPGTVWNLLDSQAAKANSYAYDAFGVARSVSETVPNLYRFGTKRLDADPALYHFIARQYGPASGRFACTDRLGLVDALVRYTPSAGPQWTLIVAAALIPYSWDKRPRRTAIAAFVLSGPWNLYVVGDNRPLVEVDPAGLWGEDLHDVLTAQWAHDARGFDVSKLCVTTFRQPHYPALIGAADYGVDLDPNTAPYPWPLRGDLTWHYGNSRALHTAREFAEAVLAARNSACVSAMWHLGRAFHPLQDIFSHNVGHHAVTWQQHISGPNSPWPFGGGPWRPDKVALWPADVAGAENATKALLTAFLSLPCNPCAECVRNVPPCQCAQCVIRRYASGELLWAF